MKERSQKPDRFAAGSQTTEGVAREGQERGAAAMQTPANGTRKCKRDGRGIDVSVCIVRSTRSRLECNACEWLLC